MDQQKYFDRINFIDNIIIDDKTWIELHDRHVFNIPLENLDIRYGKLFDLEIASIYEKIVINFRGGFCYELNSLFNSLLCQIGFNSRNNFGKNH